jgi:hypothetical protein
MYLITMSFQTISMKHAPAAAAKATTAATTAKTTVVVS